VYYIKTSDCVIIYTNEKYKKPLMYEIGDQIRKVGWSVLALDINTSFRFISQVIGGVHGDIEGRNATRGALWNYKIYK
jgi:hypothetical protein